MVTAERQEILDAIAASAGGETRELLEVFFEHTATEDLTERTPDAVRGAIDSFREFAKERSPGQTLVRVFTPTTREHGWSARRTIVQVCAQDAPFLVDSVTGALRRQGVAVYLNVHPLVGVERDAGGALLRVERPGGERQVESWMHLEIDRLPTAKARSELTEKLRSVLADVRAAVADWQAMRHTAEQVARQIDRDRPPTASGAEIEQARQFLLWLADDHFTFLGYREYALEDLEGEAVLRAVPGTGLGILRPDSDRVSHLRPEAQATAREPRVLTVTKANSRSTVHRDIYLDYIGIRTFDAAGAVTGERRFLGLFTAAAYAESVTRLPIASDKVREVLEASGFAEASHSRKDLQQILENYPRDELFADTVANLASVAAEVAHLAERRRSRVFLRFDEFGRFVSALVYLPRDRYTTAVRLRISDLLRRTFDADSVDFTTRLSDSALAQLHFMIRARRGQSIPRVDVEELQVELRETIRTWDERLVEEVHSLTDEDGASALLARFAGAFEESYKEDVPPVYAAADLMRLDGLDEAGGLRTHLYWEDDGDALVRRLKLYSRQAHSLSAVLPVLTDLGLEVIDERPYTVRTGDGGATFVYDIGLRAGSVEHWGAATTPEEFRHGPTATSFEDTFTAVLTRAAESDALNALVLRAGLTWRQVVILRAIARYSRQTGTTYSIEYLEEAMVANPAIAAALVELFEARFSPDTPAPQERQDGIAAGIKAMFDGVASLDQDRILRRYLAIIRAVWRTNAYQLDENGLPKAHVSMKVDCRALPDLPEPRPMAEIWVYSPRVEGVHLRFGKVARGGLRWSDRREDFRTEVLGLVKAQMVKNAVIVPTGSKGGFVPKWLPDPAVDRGAWIAEGQEAYRIFIRGLLDLTDNRVGTEIVPPERVVRHDGDDPYLVVAADKGTASFSDIANEISTSYGFWLDDAFASGGSAGYDHKAMGITARGAWESVKRHFRELGLDTQTEDFAVVGIGDMSGDVFGNGMLLSEHIRLVAAFDHRHVFVDPTPDAAGGFAERLRLFHLPSSSWADYDASLISDGGGVFPRTAKSVAVTPQMRTALGIEDGVAEVTPTELIRLILQAPVDLLYNGGIGTYIKSAVETNASVGDRANDAVRIDGGQVRARVVGEGGNLGVTQLGRIEAAMAGVHINTDAIDNSAGVGTSDKEVNLKILLTSLVREGGLELAERNELLASMTDEVAAQVLRDNYEQNVLLGNSRVASTENVPVHTRLIEWLEGRGELDRELEFLPSNGELARRYEAGHGLTRPEVAVLIAYAKLALKADLAPSGIAEDPWFTRTLAAYFPAAVRERYGAQLQHHPLRSEIIVNEVVNSMVNRGGITFAYRAIDETGASSEQVARAYVACREIYALASFAAAVEATDNVVDTVTQTGMYIAFRKLMDRSSRWLVQQRADLIDVTAEVDMFAEPVQRYALRMGEVLTGAELERHRERVADYVAAGVPEELAERSAGLLASLSLLDVVALAGGGDGALTEIVPLYFGLSGMLGGQALLDKVADLPQDDRWSSMARAAMRDDVYAVLAALTASVRAHTSASVAPAERIAAWRADGGDAAERALEALAAASTAPEANLATLSVALRTLRSMVR